MWEKMTNTLHHGNCRIMVKELVQCRADDVQASIHTPVAMIVCTFAYTTQCTSWAISRPSSAKTFSHPPVSRAASSWIVAIDCIDAELVEGAKILTGHYSHFLFLSSYTHSEIAISLQTVLLLVFLFLVRQLSPEAAQKQLPSIMIRTTSIDVPASSKACVFMGSQNLRMVNTPSDLTYSESTNTDEALHIAIR